jgi:hypothetical protein
MTRGAERLPLRSESSDRTFFGSRPPHARSGRSPNFRKLAVQLTLDSAVQSLRFITSLPIDDEEVAVGMLVAGWDEGSVAYDIVDERPHRDIDSEGLLLIALERHGITRQEVDAASINVEPRAGNCESIWKHRHREVSPTVREDRTGP